MEMEDSVQEEEMEKHKKQNVMEAIEKLLDEVRSSVSDRFLCVRDQFKSLFGDHQVCVGQSPLRNEQNIC